jgi:quercetin dioxygenase-like cupin family protein
VHNEPRETAFEQPTSIGVMAGPQPAILQRAMEPFAVAPGDGRSVGNPTGGVTTFKVVSDQSGGGLTVIEGISAPGEGPPLHVHREQDEFIYTLDGTYRVRLGDDVIEVVPRSFIFIPRDTPHTWQNIGEGFSCFIATLVPASVEFEVFFHRYGELAPEERGIEAFSRLAAETMAMEVLGPPLAQSDPT